MANETSGPDKSASIFEKAGHVVQGAANAVMRDGTLSALLREGLKDVQNAWFDAAYGHSDHSREPGTPLTPLFSDIRDAREHYASPQSQYAMGDLPPIMEPMPEPMPVEPVQSPMPGPTPGPSPASTPEPTAAPSPSPSPEGAATESSALKEGGFAERVKAERGQQGGGGGSDGSSFVDRLKAERAQQGENDGGRAGLGRSLADEQKAQRDDPGPDRGRGR